MAVGKKQQPDYVPAGTPETRSQDPTDEYKSSVDVGKDFTAGTDITKNGLADINEQ